MWAGNQLYNLEYSHDMGSQQRQLGHKKCQEIIGVTKPDCW